MGMNLRGEWKADYFSKLSYMDLIIFLIPVIVFSYYLYVFDPGILRYDSFDQLHQIASHQFYNWHPFFHTFIEMVLLRIYPSPISVCIFQILTFSTIWTAICRYYRYEDENLKNVFVLQVLTTSVICLIPINAVYSISLLKDILFGYFLLLTCFSIAVLLDRKGEVGMGFLVVAALAMSFVAGLRPNGIHVVIVTLIVLAAYFLKKKYDKRVIITLVSLVIVFILLIASLNAVYDVSDNQKSALRAKVVHMLADYDLNLTLTPQDSAKLHEVINESAIRSNYHVTYSDPIYEALNMSAYDKDKYGYLEMAFRYSVENPQHFAKYLLDSSPMVWDIARDGSWIGMQYIVDLQSAKNSFFSYHQISNITPLENVSSKNIGTDQFDTLNNFTETFKSNIILDTLCNSPALYMYLAFALMGMICFMTKSKEIFLVYLPNMVNIVIIFLSTPIQDNRYLYPNLLICYFLIIMLIGITAKKKLNNFN